MEARQAFKEAVAAHRLHGIELIKAIDSKDHVILVCKGPIAPLIGKEGTVVKELKQKLNKKVRVIEHTEARKMIQDLLGSVPLIGFTKAFPKPGASAYTLLLAKKDMEKLAMEQAELERVLNDLLESQTSIAWV
mgnify:CR=1 FL=1